MQKTPVFRPRLVKKLTIFLSRVNFFCPRYAPGNRLCKNAPKTVEATNILSLFKVFNWIYMNMYILLEVHMEGDSNILYLHTLLSQCLKRNKRIGWINAESTIYIHGGHDGVLTLVDFVDQQNYGLKCQWTLVSSLFRI